MIDRTHPLPLAQQCRILGAARSSAYYTPRPVSSQDLALMRRIDELHLPGRACCATSCAAMGTRSAASASGH